MVILFFIHIAIFTPIINREIINKQDIEISELKNTIAIYQSNLDILLTEETTTETDEPVIIVNAEEAKTVDTAPPALFDVPSINTSIKLFTDYRYYNIKGTPHYRLQQECWTDEYGCRRFNDDYCVAVGSFYSTDIGDRFRVTLNTGTVFTVIVADGKWDCDCDFLNQYTPCYDYDGREYGNLLEFIVDDCVLDTECFNYGSLDYYDTFKGSIVKMEYLGRDTSQDWGFWEEGWENNI